MLKVIDEKKSEVGLQRKRFNNKSILLHSCCVCGAVDMWRSTWSSYYSFKDLDDENLIPKFCSKSCASKAGDECENITDEMLQEAKTRELRPPKIVYREATDDEKWKHAVGLQRRK